MNGQFLGSKSHSFLGDFHRDAVGLEEDATRAHACGPRLGSTFTFTHTNTQTLGGHGTIGEYANPKLTLTFHLTSDGLTGCFYLAGADPALIQRLDGE